MRDNRIDILRFIGLAMVIFAHSGATGLLFQLRNFDVPLMVIVSGMSFSLSYKPTEKYYLYLWKRLKRLVFPVWIFLTIFFAALYVFLPNSSLLEPKTIITSYTLISGIGYVWIIRVFLLVVAVSPIIYMVHKKIESELKFAILIALLFIIFEIIRYYSLPYIQSGLPQAISFITHYLIPYSLVFSIGLRLPTLNKNQTLTLTAVCFLVFTLLAITLYAITGRFIPTQALKYPPSIYYFSYALFVTSFLWLISKHLEELIEKIKIKNTLMFIAQNSMWIYLWHIPFVGLIQAHFMLKYAIVFTVSVVITKIQVEVIHAISNIFREKPVLCKNLRFVLTG